MLSCIKKNNPINPERNNLKKHRDKENHMKRSLSVIGWLTFVVDKVPEHPGGCAWLQHGRQPRHKIHRRTQVSVRVRVIMR